MRPRLVTIRYSHYCEKARWALERARVDFVEERHERHGTRRERGEIQRRFEALVVATDDFLQRSDNDSR